MTSSCASGRTAKGRASTSARPRATAAFDFGANAARIRSLMNEIDDAIAAQKQIRPKTPAPPKKTSPIAKAKTNKKEQDQRNR